MDRRAAWVVLVVGGLAWAGNDGVAARAPKARKPFLTPAQVLERLEASPITFEIKPIEKLEGVSRGRLADETWKQLVAPVNLPKVRRRDGAVIIEAWPEPASAADPSAKAEEAFRAKKYDEAEKWYRKALERAPDLYILHAYVGDAILFGNGDPKLALEEYSRAIAKNPDDYRLYFFRANAHRHLQQADASLADLRRSLVLKPRNQVLVTAVQRAGGTMGRIEPDLFVPRAFVRREGAAVAIYADVERPEWLAWANCKALWLTDEAHRVEMIGSKQRGFSTVEETECLAALVSLYAARLESGEGMRDDRLDRLVTIVNDGLASSFVVYELGSRVDPQIVLHLDASFREQLARYVEKYVLTAPE
ncbi:MAG: tetratricopeptide repeat protein [Myxococcota bacterium]